MLTWTPNDSKTVGSRLAAEAAACPAQPATTFAAAVKRWAGRQIRTARLGVRELRALTKRPEPAPEVAQVMQSLEALAAMGVRPPDRASDGERPVFVLAAGWRTGSTLLQRTLATDPHLLLWGEPLGRLSLIPRLTEALTAVTGAWPLEKHWGPPEISTARKATSWTANFFPPPASMRAAFRELLDAWLQVPARERGFTRWGFKEVRLSAADALVLGWLYPNARFVLLTRHPYAAYRSVAGGRRDWRVYYRWPDACVSSAAEFARHWDRIVTSWSQLPPDFPCRRIRYEDMVAPGFDWRDLEAWLDVSIDERAALSVRVGATERPVVLSLPERFAIDGAAARGMAAFGYGPGGAVGDPRTTTA